MAKNKSKGIGKKILAWFMLIAMLGSVLMMAFSALAN